MLQHEEAHVAQGVVMGVKVDAQRCQRRVHPLRLLHNALNPNDHLEGNSIRVSLHQLASLGAATLD